MNWERINHEFDRIDRATYGLAELVVVGGTCSLIFVGLYCVLYRLYPRARACFRRVPRRRRLAAAQAEPPP